MLSSGETAELRELQRRAYAPGDGLSAAEAARLHELEDKRVMAAESAAAEPESVPATSVTEPAADVVSPADAAGPEAPGVGAAEDAGITDPAPRAKRRSPWVPLAAGAALLLVGLGAGWAIAESLHTPASVAVTAEQQARGEQIAPEGTDPGSLIALGEREGVLAWYVTKSQGAQTCLVLDGGGDEVETSCSRTDSLSSYPVSAALDIASDDAGDYIDVTFASLAFSPDGRPAVSLSGHRSVGSTTERYANDEERTIAADLQDAGYRADSLYVVGYYAGQPIWTAVRGAAEYCLLYIQPDGIPLGDCGEFGDLESDPLTVEFVASRDGSDFHVNAQLTSSPQVSEYLTITETPVNVAEVDVDSGAIVDDATGDAG